MEHLGLLFDVVVALGGAMILGLLAARLGQSPIIGYLLAGVLVGPGVLAVLGEPAEVRLLAELGVALLLFTIGLEFSWSRLRALGPVAALGGTLQIVVTGLLGGLAGLALGRGAAEAAVIGMILALSSTAVVFRVLAERGAIDSTAGRVVVGILLAQDIAVIPLVLVVPMLEAGGEQGEILFQLGGTVLRAALLILGMIAVSRFLLPGLFQTAAAKSRELFIILGLTFCLAATWAAAAWGLSPVLGAFVAGVLLADSRYANQIRSDIGPLRAGFVALFFVSIGMLAEPAWVARHAPAVAAAVLAIVLGKALIAGSVIRAFRYPLGTAVAGGFTLAHIGELSFVVADLGRLHGIVSLETFQFVVSTSVVSLLLTPYVIAGSESTREWIRKRIRPRPATGEELGEVTHGHERSGHVIVVGYGPTGARVVKALRNVGTPYLVIELNPRTVAEARSRGLEIEFGDATHEEILREASLENALALVVTLPDPAAAVSVVQTARSLRADLPVVARARYGKFARRLAESGADVLANEEELMGEKLADVTLRMVGIASEAVARIHPVETQG